MGRELFTPNRLFCPGPTPSPWFVKEAALETDIYHRSKEFEQIVLECASKLKPLFGVSTQPVILTTSGTGGMESLLVKLTDEGDEVIVLVAGKFGERWQKLNAAYGNKPHVAAIEFGKIPRASDIDRIFKQCPRPKAIFFQANETSTGARLPVEELCQAIRRHNKDTLIVVDAVSSLGAHTLEMDKWGIDAAVSGSQKGFGVAPGLAFVALSERAWKHRSKRGKFYFDLDRERKGQETGRTAWTPAVSLMLSLQASLREIDRIGVSAFAAHHDRLGRATRAAFAAIGLELFVEKDAVSSALTAIRVPEGIDGSKLLADIKARYGAIVSGGQDDLKGKIIRFSHLGFVGPFNLIDGLAAVEFGLADAGWKFTLGSGVAAAMAELHRS